MINMIVNGFNGEIMHKVLANISQNLDINYANIIYHEAPAKKLKVRKADYLDYDRIFDTKNYPLNPNEMIPLDEKLIREMNDCERIVLKMIDRKEISQKYSYEDRIRFYHYYLRYWNHIIETKKINLYLVSNVPHEIYDFIACELCRLKKIPTIFLYNESQTPDTVLILNDWKESSLKLKNKYEKLKKIYQKIDLNDIKLCKRFNDYYENQTSEKSDPPFYMGRDFYIASKIRVISKIFSKIPGMILQDPVKGLRFLITITKRQVSNRYLDLYYRRHSKTPDLSSPYIYFALHYQPELTTSPLADAYVNQLLIVQMLSKYLPKGLFIYVKEHPRQTSLCRSINFYNDLASTNNVVLVKKNFSTEELIKGATAVVTATGTVGWEAMCKRKPVLMFGSYIYQFYDGVYKIRTKEDCAKIIKKILKKDAAPSLKDLKVFLKAVEDVAIPATVDSAYLKTSKLTTGAIVRNLSQAILTEIKQTIKRV